MNDPNQPITPAAKKSIAIMLFIFLLLFHKYAPFEHAQVIATDWISQIFVMAFFITNQTLGIVHEGGHGVCYILHCPEFITAANGTIFQLLFPFLIGLYYKKQGKPFIYFVGLFFLGISLQYSAWYISTAHFGEFIPASKSFLGVDAKHDFYMILSTLHLLSYDGFISSFVKVIAYLIMLYSSLKMIYIAFFMRDTTLKNRREKLKRFMK